MTTRIKLRRDTAANWTENDPVLALGEAGYDTTNNELRVGDGTTAWSGLESIGGTGNKITAQKTYSNNHNDGSDQTFTYTTGSIAVQMGNDSGLYLNDLLSRWVQYFDGNLDFPYNYSDVSLVINPGTTNLSTTVTNVISDGGTPPLYTITLGTTDPGPIVVDDIDFNYTYINTIGLDTVNDYFGMATGDDDIDIRSGQDIDLVAADDIWMSAGDNLQLLLVNLDDSSSSHGIKIVTETTASTKTWTFRFDGSLELPEGLSLPTQTNKGYDLSTNLTGPTLRLSNDSQNQVIVTGPAATENNSYAQRIVIQGQRGYGSTSTQGEGGDIYIWGGIGGETNDNSNGWGPGGGSGGDVKLRGGEGLNDTGGYVRIEGGNVAHFSTSTTGDAGFVEITGGDVEEDNNAVSSLGGDVTITGGRAYSASTQSGVVQVITGGTTNPDVAGENYWEFGNSGTLTLPEGSILSGTRENVTVTLDQFNDGGFTGTQVFSKVSDTLYELSPGGPTMELVSGVWYLKIGVATYYNSTDLMTWAESAGGLPTPVGTIGTLATTNLTLDANTWTFSGNGALTLPGVLIKSTVAKTGGGVGTETAIDLTKSVNKLTTGTYTLADGVDGQIMYLVRQTTATTAVTVTVANSRLDGFMQTDIPFTPFTDGTDPTNMATLIFTDSAWQSMGGFWNLT